MEGDLVLETAGGTLTIRPNGLGDDSKDWKVLVLTCRMSYGGLKRVRTPPFQRPQELVGFGIPRGVVSIKSAEVRLVHAPLRLVR